MRLRAISSVLPEWRVDNETISKWSGLEVATIQDKLGVTGRRFLTHEETTSGLAAQAVEKLLQDNVDLAKEDIDILVVVTQNPDYKLPHVSALLQDSLGLKSSIAAFDINLGCSGYVYALSTVKGMMLGEGMKNAVLVTCDPYSKIMARENRDVIGLFGDGATASWISAEQGGEIGFGDYGTDGSGAEHLIVKSGGATLPNDNLDGNATAESSDAEGHLHMNGRAIFNFMMTGVPGTVDRCLERNSLTREDVDLFVFHQANAFMLKGVAKKMRLPMDKVPINMEERGNTVSSSIPFVLGDFLPDRKLAGKKVLICGFGVGLSWATNIISFPN